MVPSYRSVTGHRSGFGALPAIARWGSRSFVVVIRGMSTGITEVVTVEQVTVRTDVVTEQQSLWATVSHEEFTIDDDTRHAPAIAAPGAAAGRSRRRDSVEITTPAHRRDWGRTVSWPLSPAPVSPMCGWQ